MPQNNSPKIVLTHEWRGLDIEQKVFYNGLVIRDYKCKRCGGQAKTGERGSIPEFCPQCRPKVYKERYYIPHPRPGTRRGSWSSFSKLRLELLNKAQNKCSECGKQSSDLDIHHLDREGYGKTNFPNNDINNLKVLCTSCHLRLHYGSTIEAGKIDHLRAECKNLEQIEQIFNVSKQRIHQIYLEFIAGTDERR